MIPLKEVSECIKAGRMIQAIQLVQESTGSEWVEAKEFVDELERMMKTSPGTPCGSAVSAVDGMEGHAFELFCAELLRNNGFSEVTVTPGSGDQGVDVLAVKDGVKYAIQCKNYAGPLSNTPVQEVSAGRQFYGCHVGVVMTNSTFTPGAVSLAAATNVLLWDRKKLEELIVAAGGLAGLGIYPEYGRFEPAKTVKNTCSAYEADDDENIDEAGGTSVAWEIPVEHTSNRPRKGMKIWSRICLVWSVLCFSIFGAGFASSDQEIMTVGLGEGLFVFVLGLMFGALAKTEKGDPYIFFLGKRMKKYLFVILCIVIAYIFFLGAIKATGWI